MQVIDTLLVARWIIPVQPDRLVLHDHTIAIHRGDIIDLLPTAEARTRYQATEVVELPNHAIIPGFVNTHTHVAMSLFRGVADDLPLMEWLQNNIWPAEAKWVGPDFVRDGTALSVAEMIRSGTTCFSDMYFFPEETARMAREAGVRACIGLVVIDFPTAWAKSADEYIDKGLRLHDELRSSPLITSAFAPHAPYSVSDEPLNRIRVLADEVDMAVHMHVHETRDEVRQSIDRFGVRPLERLRSLGLLTNRLLAVHMTQLTDEEIGLLAANGTHVIHCPESNLKIASGFCPVHKLSTAGANVALGTDGAASNNDQDMLGEMRTAALLAKGVSGDATALPASGALRMATLNGAKSLGLEDRIGSLEPGKSADLTAIDLSGLSCQPVYDPISQIVYAANRDHVTDVWVAGKRLLHNRRLTTLDESEITRRAQAWRGRIKAP